MSSNMLAGERRWASARRGGMTVLGKVAVPKPLNLPSQRLENHGLDPSVEIVPKGTLSWGSRASSSGSNAWTSSLSPNADAGNTSPSYHGGRPSSGGSGTRPSTAGSDKTHEPIASAWGSNSRPSSASGALTSSQSSSTLLRPRSAENRPNSSQLSRFAEPLSESPVAWGPSSTAERLGIKSSKEDGFSLSSGDFPTLGTEKDNSVKNFESQDHGHPISASGRITQSIEEDSNQADARRGMVNTWRIDGSRMAEDGIHPNMENWQGEPQQYFNPNVAPQHFDAWRGPPVNAPAGVWYRGPPRGPAFGAPSGFPMEPFPPYYRPQIPPPALGGSQPVPPPGAGPRGPHPPTGELYRPHMHDSYARPGAPFRPSFYSRPPGPMTFDGYYGPPMGYCNNERDIPYMGMAAAPPVYGGYAGQSAHDTVTSPARVGGHGITGKTMSEHMEADHLEDTPGSKRVPLKNHGEWDRKEEGVNWEHNVQHNVSHPGKSSLPMITSRKNEWGAENDGEEDMFPKRKLPGENASRSFQYRDHSSESVRVKSFESMGNVKGDDDSWTSKAESVAELPLAGEEDALLRPASKDSSLMQKIEGLNAKVRASERRNDTLNAYNREEQRNRPQIVDLEVNNNTREVVQDFVPVPQRGVGTVGEKSIQPVALVSRRVYHGGQGRVDHHGKGKYHNQDTDGWRRKPLATEFSSAITPSNIESASIVHMHEPGFVGEAADNSVTNPVGKIEGESVAEASESTDVQAQRAKMRELAKQRALQLQREEEERIKEQKAKALAKLEELNRRTQAGEAANLVAEKIEAISEIQGDRAESLTIGDPVTVHPQLEVPCTNLVSEPGIADVERESSTNKAGESVEEVSTTLPQDMPTKVPLESIDSRGYSMPSKQDTNTANARNVPSQLNGGTYMHKRTGYKQKQDSLLQKSSNEKSASNSASAQKNHGDAAAVDTKSTKVPVPTGEIKPGSESVVHNRSPAVAAPSTHHGKKVNRSTKNKNKLDETAAAPLLPAITSNIIPERELSENRKFKAPLSNWDSSVSTVIEPDGWQGHEASSLPNEESLSRVTNQWKPQPPRRMPRGQQANRYMDKVHGSEVIWAPVRTLNKAEDSGDASEKSTLEANSAKSDNVAQNSFKGKRAEMERYVPKPVAKELAQQGSVPLLSSSVSDEAPGAGQLGSVTSADQQLVSSSNVGSSVEIKEADSRLNKHRKDHGQWRQRGKTDSSHTRPSPLSEPNKDIQQSTEQRRLGKSEKDSAKAEIKISGNVNSWDLNNCSNDTTTADVSRSDAGKDQGATGRGKRHLPRGHRGTGNNADHENVRSGRQTDGSSVQSGAPEVKQTDRAVDSKENQSLWERTSHWKPKSHPNSTNHQHGNRTAGSETLTTEINKHQKKDPLHKVQLPPQHGIETSNIFPDQLVFGSIVAEDSIVGYHHEFNQEKKFAPAKGHPLSSNQDQVFSGESAPATNTDVRNERNISGSGRNGQNNRFSRGHESRGNWSSGQDNRLHNVPALHERQRQNVQYEYHPVGPTKGGQPENFDGPADGGVQRYRERGQSHPKRGGNFYRRQPGGVRIDAGQN